MSLAGKTPASTYKDLIQLENSGNGVRADGGTTTLSDGNGTETSV